MTAASLQTKLKGLLEGLGQPALHYAVSTTRWPEAMKRCFLELEPDAALCEFLASIPATRATRGRTWLQRSLRWVMSDYDANALLDMYPMHLLSTRQAERLLMRRSRSGTLLDIGAGNGDVTAALAPLFERVCTVEASRWARRRLSGRGFGIDTYDATQEGIRGGPYDVIALLNVLDRTARPLTLLDRLYRGMSDTSLLLLSVPLPYRPHSYRGPMSREPEERLPIVGNHFSDALLRLVQQVLVPQGFEVVRMTRLPYLSGGDSDCPMTALDAAVVLCRKAARSS
ncbi:MAG TPA: methyltransferase domain-containing protein [Polyangiaceae bacterium]